MEPLGINFSKVWSKIHNFHLWKCIWKCRLQNRDHVLQISMVPRVICFDCPGTRNSISTAYTNKILQCRPLAVEIKDFAFFINKYHAELYILFIHEPKARLLLKSTCSLTYLHSQSPTLSIYARCVCECECVCVCVCMYMCTYHICASGEETPGLHNSIYNIL